MPEGQIGNTVYDNLGGFLSGENIPTKFHEYFDEYDPAREELLEQELGVDSKRKRFEFGQQKRQMLSQKSKMGFAGAGAMETQQASMYDMFTGEMGLMGATTRLDIAEEKEDWLSVQYGIAESMADDIDAEREMASLDVYGIANKIHNRDTHWEKGELTDYDSNATERKFIRNAWDVGKAEMDTYRKISQSSKTELKNMYGAMKSGLGDVTDPGV